MNEMREMGSLMMRTMLQPGNESASEEKLSVKFYPVPHTHESGKKVHVKRTVWPADEERGRDRIVNIYERCRRRADLIWHEINDGRERASASSCQKIYCIRTWTFPDDRVHSTLSRTRRVHPIQQPDDNHHWQSVESFLSHPNRKINICFGN